MILTGYGLLCVEAVPFTAALWWAGRRWGPRGVVATWACTVLLIAGWLWIRGSLADPSAVASGHATPATLRFILDGRGVVLPQIALSFGAGALVVRRALRSPEGRLTVRTTLRSVAVILVAHLLAVVALAIVLTTAIATEARAARPMSAPVAPPPF